MDVQAGLDLYWRQRLITFGSCRIRENLRVLQVCVLYLIIVADSRHVVLLFRLIIRKSKGDDNKVELCRFVFSLCRILNSKKIEYRTWRDPATIVNENIADIGGIQLLNYIYTHGMS